MINWPRNIKAAVLNLTVYEHERRQLRHRPLYHLEILRLVKYLPAVIGIVKNVVCQVRKSYGLSDDVPDYLNAYVRNRG